MKISNKLYLISLYSSYFSFYCHVLIDMPIVECLTARKRAVKNLTLFSSTIKCKCLSAHFYQIFLKKKGQI